MTNRDKPGAAALTLVPPVGAPESATAKRDRERHERFLAKQAEKAEKESKAQAARDRIRVHNATAGRGLPRVQLGADPESIRTIAATINDNVLPDTYVRAGAVVSVETPSGDVTDKDVPPQVIVTVDQKRLARLLAEHTFTYEMRNRKLPDGESELVEVEAMPKDAVAAAALASTHWPRLRPLNGIVTAPVFRPDGSLVQEPGYDPVTALIYSPKLPIANVPERPSRELLQAAKAFLMDALLRDFPWVGPSRANYIGALTSPLMRGYLGGALLPLFAVDAASPSTGKSLLTEIMTSIYSGYTRSWVSDDVELRKAITSILVDQGGAVVCFDNVGKAEAVDQPTLAALLTAKVWSDRILGGSVSARVPNDRAWFVTGNAISIGGDIPSRAVLIRLDANMPDPDLRPSSQYALGDLDEWLKEPENRATLLFHLLVLMRGWIAAGAPRIEAPMRSFTPWASATAGFLGWLKEPGFMSNRAGLTEADDEESTYGAFYARWYELFGDRVMKTMELRDSAMPDLMNAMNYDWKGTFLVRKRDGQVPSAQGLGKMLTAERGRFRGGYRLNGYFDPHTKVWSYSVTPAPPAEMPLPGVSS
ncbi:MAG TPA: hypothetical protein VK453_25245 [Micromonosporaceae bacterium]|nr:hypothetical protein [Micromonosporaceae bacterium]